MRKTMMVAALLAAVTSATALHAQGNPPGGGRRGGMGRGGMGGPGMMEGELLKGITLNDGQKAKLDQIHEAERAKMEAEGGRGGGRAEMDSMRAARERGDTATAQRLMAEQRAKASVRLDTQITAIRGILTADQLPQFDTNVADVKKRAAEGRGRRGGPPGQKP
jgi:Spy/CpxP family protein refolding chaperone